MKPICYRCLAAIFLGLFSLLLAAGPAQAHRLNVFAWLENDSVIVECNFGRAHPAIDAKVVILDSDTHRQLAQGATDAKGLFVFKVPAVVRDGHGIVIDVNAGQGHHNEWQMEASELYAAASLTAGFDEAAIDTEQQARKKGITKSLPSAAETRHDAAAPPESANLPMPANQLSADHLGAIINEAIDRQIAPIRHQLAMQSASGPSLSEIVGGIGWIIGLVGIFLYFKSRRK